MAAAMIPFPKKQEQNENELEVVLRKWLRELSPDPDMENHVTERMLHFVEHYASTMFEPVFNLPAPAQLSEKEAKAMLAAIQEGVDRAAEQVQEMINKIIIERFFLEVDIYRMRQSGDMPRLKKTH